MSQNEDRIVSLTDSMPEQNSTIDDAQVAQAVAGANHDSELCGRKVRVTFYEQEVDGGDKPIFCSLNFYAYQIPRGKAVDIPIELLAVFEDANTRVVSTNDKGGVSERNVKRFNYTVHGEVQKKDAPKAKKAA